jgi:hypothetical protein
VATNISAKLLLENDIWIGLGMDGTPHPASSRVQEKEQDS